MNDRDVELLTIPEAARLLRQSISTTRRWIYQGILPARRIGPRRVFILRKDVLEFIEKSLYPAEKACE